MKKLLSSPKENGHSIECRICAESPDQDFANSTGLLEIFEAGNTESFARAVEQALARGWSEDAQRELKNNWAWEVVVEKFLNQLEAQGIRA